MGEKIYMIAKKQSFWDKNRQPLHKIIPLDMPLSLFIEASSSCDLRCNFCAFSSETALEQRNHIARNMSEEIFTLAIEQLKEFPQSFKRCTFTGLGEPLLNPRLPTMIKAIKDNEIAPEVMLFSNAVSLTHAKSEALVDSGLDIITISVNGLRGDDYERICGRSINFDKFVQQIAFLYSNKGNLRINLKIVNSCINNDEDEQLFFDTFGNICDFINIEVVAPLMKGVNYSDDNMKNSQSTSKYSELTAIKRICSQPFYKLYVSSIGKVCFCDIINGLPYDGLDIYQECLKDIWNGDVHKELLLNMLRGINEGASSVCTDCFGRHAYGFELDDLDPYAESLFKNFCTYYNT